MVYDKTIDRPTAPSRSREQRNGRLLTVSEAARMMNAHPNSIRRWADIGLLPSYRIGVRGDRRFKAEDVRRFLETPNGAASTAQPNGHDT